MLSNGDFDSSSSYSYFSFGSKLKKSFKKCLNGAYLSVTIELSFNIDISIKKKPGLAAYVASSC